MDFTTHYLDFYMPWLSDIFLKKNCVNAKRSSSLALSPQKRVSKILPTLYYPHSLKTRATLLQNQYTLKGILYLRHLKIDILNHVSGASIKADLKVNGNTCFQGDMSNLTITTSYGQINVVNHNIPFPHLHVLA